MKRNYTLCLLYLSCFLMISCGTKKNTTDAIVTESPLIEPIFTNAPTISPEPTMEQDHFVGEYNEPDSDLPNLQIEKKEDGTYNVEIGYFGTYYVPPCEGKLVNDKIEFSKTAEGHILNGTITEEDNVAIVTFLTTWWDAVNPGDTFKYYKTSDIPYKRYHELVKVYTLTEDDFWIIPSFTPDPTIKEENFVGEYNDWDTDEPNLEIKKNEDGTYEVEIGIFRLYHLRPCQGKFIDGRIEFSSEQIQGHTLNGVITLKDDIATVTFVSDCWKMVSYMNTYEYYKTSDIPYEKY